MEAIVRLAERARLSLGGAGRSGVSSHLLLVR